MRLKVLVFLTVLISSASLSAQVQASAQRGGARIGIGGGIDYWNADYWDIKRLGPAAWVTVRLWHGLGVIAEGHSMIATGDDSHRAYQYKYYSGDGGLTYTFNRWHRFEPFVKGEVGFASLSFPHAPTALYTHDTRTTWAIGGGAEYYLSRHLAVRADYTWDNFPNFYSSVTGQHHTLNPNGVTVGGTFHF